MLFAQFSLKEAFVFKMPSMNHLPYHLSALISLTVANEFNTLTYSTDTTQLSVQRSLLSLDIASLENFQSYTGLTSLLVDDDSLIEKPIFSTKFFEE